MKHVAQLILVLGLILPLAFSSVLAEDGSGNKTIQITDDRGRTINVPYPCERIVFLVENAMNTMYAVGGAGNISGIGDIWMPE